MNEADQIWEESGDIYGRWGLTENPFSESASVFEQPQLHKVFTGRKKELKEVFRLFRGRQRKRIYVYGWIGIGKSAFILEVLDVLRRKDENALVAYINLSPDMDLATAAFIALARQMPDDEWAQQQLNQLGLRPATSVNKRKTAKKLNLKIAEWSSEVETSSVNKPQFPAMGFESLLETALEKHDRVVIAIDDLDKLDPEKARELLHDAQGILKSGAWFILTGQPSGLAREVLTVERGLFDRALKLEKLDVDTTYAMLVNYLNSVRLDDVCHGVEDPKAVHPFTPEAARLLCERSGGYPRYLNRLASYTLMKAALLEAETISRDVLVQGFDYADEQLRKQLTLEELDILELVLEKKIFSDANITLTELERLKVQEFGEMMAALERLVQLDILRRIPSEVETMYRVSPMIQGKTEQSE